MQLIKDGLATVKITQTSDNSEYKVGQRILVKKAQLQELIIDGDTAYNTYYTHEDNVFAKL